VTDDAIKAVKLIPVAFLWMTIGQFRREFQRCTSTMLAVPHRPSRRTFTSTSAARFVVPFEIPSSPFSSIALAWFLLRFMESHMCSSNSGNELISLSYVIGTCSVYGFMVFGSSLRRPYLMTRIHGSRFPSGQGTYITTTWSNPDRYGYSEKVRTVQRCLRHAL
jgi:hypothetical protein